MAEWRTAKHWSKQMPSCWHNKHGDTRIAHGEGKKLQQIKYICLHELKSQLLTYEPVRINDVIFYH